MAKADRSAWSIANLPHRLQLLAYERHAQAYLTGLPPERFLEAVAQATQRKITLESFDLVTARRPDVHVFNELLVQYPVRDEPTPGQVVPDNMVVLTDGPIEATASYNVAREPAPPFLVLEYVWHSNQRKDFVESYRQYERELKVPYYLIFYPDNQELTLYRHNRRKYVSVKPDRNGRHAIGPLELEVAILDGWVRYWYRGELLPLPAEMQRALDEARRRADEEKQRADEEKQRADEEKQRADEEKQRADTLARQLDAMQKELAAHRERPA